MSSLKAAVELITRVFRAEVVDADLLGEAAFARRWNASHPQDEVAAILVAEVAATAGTERRTRRRTQRNFESDDLSLQSTGDM